MIIIINSKWVSDNVGRSCYYLFSSFIYLLIIPDLFSLSDYILYFIFIIYCILHICLIIIEYTKQKWNKKKILPQQYRHQISTYIICSSSCCSNSCSSSSNILKELNIEFIYIGLFISFYYLFFIIIIIISILVLI